MTDRLVFELPTEEQKAQVRKQLGTSEDDIRQAVSCLRHWLQAQPHLPHAMDDGRLERMYISSKCRTEKVKSMLDAYYTFKTKFPDVLMNRDPRSDDIALMRKFLTLLNMPRLTPDFHRVGVLTNISPHVPDFNTTIALKASLMGLDYVLSFDYSIGYIFLVDLKNTTAGHLSKLSLRDVRALETICRRAYSKRIVAIHFVNASKIIDMLLAMVKPVLPEKLRQRVMVHLPGARTLFDHVPEEFVPNEMGGTAGPTEELAEAIRERLLQKREWFLEEDKYVVDENKRPQENGGKHDYELFGMDGSFKKLQLD